MFNCNQCTKGFNCKTKLKYHTMSYHMGVKPFLCQQCGAGFTANLSLREHMNTHTGETPYKCSECPQSFARLATLNRHKGKEHSAEPKSCKICDSSFSHKYSLAQHMKNAHGKKAKFPSVKPKPNKTCDMCSKSFSTVHGYKQHVKTIHDGIRDYECPICQKKFTTKNHLVDHLPVHDRKARFFCQYCGEGFIHRVSYKNHIFRHEQGPRKVVCPVCAKTFDVPAHLQRHIARIHKGMSVAMPAYDMPKSHLPKELKEVNPDGTVKQESSPAIVKVAVEKRRIGDDNAVANTSGYSTYETEEIVLQGGQEMEYIVEGQENQIVVEGGAVIGGNVVTEEIQGVEEGMRTVEIEVNGVRQIMYVPEGVNYVQIADQVISLAEYM